jgi:hypothetical protein
MSKSLSYGNAKDLSGGTECAHCGKPLRGRFVWLELDQRSGTYTNGDVPPEHSQGAFPIGVSCAKALVG